MFLLLLYYYEQFTYLKGFSFLFLNVYPSLAQTLDSAPSYVLGLQVGTTMPAMLTIL